MKQIVRNNIFILKEIWNVDKRYFFYAVAKVLINAIESVAALLIARYILLALELDVNIRRVLLLCVALLSVRLINSRISCWFHFSLDKKMKLNVQSRFQTMIMEKTKAVDQECYDDTEFYNSYILALNEVDSRAMEVFYSFVSACSSVLSLISVVAIMIYLDPVLILISLLGLITDFLIFTARMKLYYRYDKERAVIERKRDYIKRIFYIHDYSKELKIFPIRNNLIERYEEHTEEQRNLQKRWFGKITELDILSDSLATAVTTFITFYLAYNVLTGKIAIADYVTLQSTTVMLGNNLKGVSAVLNVMRENSLYIGNFLQFMNYESKIEAKDSGENLKLSGNTPFEVEFKNVSFKYPKAKNYTIKNLSFKVKSGEKIAIVGYNGAGKTTLMKLLLRFYEPTMGEILINGTPIKDLSLEEYRKQLGIVFQDFKTYALTVGENLMEAGKIGKSAGIIRSALEKSKIAKKVFGFENGIDTYLTKEFDDNGECLSGGELQKLAIARAFVKKNRMIVMDEPSSALDPIAENEIIQSVMELTNDNTVMLITHRLSTLKLADRIIYMEDGEAKEIGTHDELMMRSGKYAKLYKTQVNNYIIYEPKEVSKDAV